MKSCDTNQRNVDTRMDNRETQRQIESTKKVKTRFNKDSEAETKTIQRMKK